MYPPRAASGKAPEMERIEVLRDPTEPESGCSTKRDEHRDGLQGRGDGRRVKLI